MGSTTYDADTKSDFTMKALLMWCMHDFPAYAHCIQVLSYLEN